jgi:WhiB family transcriptional regulator, redox-sensing transcriptional regulator
MMLIPKPLIKGIQSDDSAQPLRLPGRGPRAVRPIGNAAPAILQVEEARVICRRCDVIKTCLTWASNSGQDAGVWGGLSEDERRASNAEMPVHAAPAELRHLYPLQEVLAHALSYHWLRVSGAAMAFLLGLYAFVAWARHRKGLEPGIHRLGSHRA